MGITIDKWGPSAWNTLHAFAHKANQKISKDEEEEWVSFFYLFARRLPCPKCRVHLKNYLDSNMVPLETRDDLVRFVHDVHNDVNRRLGKPVWTYSEHCQLYSLKTPKKEADFPIFPVLLSIVLVVVLRKTLKNHKSRK